MYNEIVCGLSSMITFQRLPPRKFAVLKITELDGKIGYLDKQYYLSCTVNEDQIQIDLSLVSTN